MQGYGDITPQTPAEQLVAVCYMATAVFYFGQVGPLPGSLPQPSAFVGHVFEGVGSLPEQLRP